MAKFGEGDKRWIVKERDDGRNVNSWHWEEKNQTEWAKSRLTSILVGLKPVDEPTMRVQVTKVSSISGEVTLQSRKQRRFALYELDIQLNWEAQTFDADGTVQEETKGTARVEDLSEETLDDLPFEMSCDNTAGRREELKEAMRTKGAAAIKAKALEWVAELKALVASGEAKGDLVDIADGETPPQARPPPSERVNNSYVVSGGGEGTLSTVEVNYTFPIARAFLYESLLDANRMRAATCADAIIEAKEGGEMRLFNGTVEGRFETLTPHEKIVQKWRFSTWQPGHYSDVTIALKEDGGNTVLDLVQTGVPVEEKDRTERGWRSMIFDRLKMVLGGVPP